MQYDEAITLVVNMAREHLEAHLKNQYSPEEYANLQDAVETVEQSVGMTAPEPEPEIPINYEGPVENMTCSQIALMEKKQQAKRFKPSSQKAPTASIQDLPAKGPLAKGLKATGQTQEKLAKQVGVHSSTLSRYKLSKGSGKRRPSFQTLKNLSDKTGRDPAQLFPELG